MAWSGRERVVASLIVGGVGGDNVEGRGALALSVRGQTRQSADV